VYTVTNEVEIASNVATTVDVQTKMRFSNVNTTTHVQISYGNYTIRPYVSPTSTATVNIRYGQIWMGSEPFAAGIAPKNCFNSVVPGNIPMSISEFFPLIQLGTTLTNSAGEVCVTTEKGTYTSQECNSGSSCTDLDSHDVSIGKNTRGGGNPDLLNWEFIPVDWVKNGYYVRSKGSEKLVAGFGSSYVKYEAVSVACTTWMKPAGMKVKPYLKWGSYLGKIQDIGSSSNENLANGFLAFVSGLAVGTTLGMYDPDLPSRNDPANVFFTSFPPQFQTIGYPCSSIYADLQTLPSQGPGGSKYDDKDYIFVIEPV
jgi:hypothetical protein